VGGSKTEPRTSSIKKTKCYHYIDLLSVKFLLTVGKTESDRVREELLQWSDHVKGTEPHDPVWLGGLGNC
jgi:hypothetical protein